MSEYVLDSSAVLALMFQEPGMERVEEILDKSVIGRVNTTEVLTKLVERGASLNEAVENLSELGIPVVELDEPQSTIIAQLRLQTKHLGLSLGDRACLALAIKENAIAATADRNWTQLNVCQIISIR